MYAFALCCLNQLISALTFSHNLENPSKPACLSSSVAANSFKNILSCLIASAGVSIIDSPVNLFFLSSVLSSCLVCVFICSFLLMGLSYRIVPLLSINLIPQCLFNYATIGCLVQTFQIFCFR